MDAAVADTWTNTLDTRYLFFTGKGGVGKTSLACAAAVHLARQGRRTFIVSTDPASNLDEVFGVKLGTEATPISEKLFGANLDPEEAARAYREKMVGPYRGKLPPAVIRNMEEQFSGACTTEIAAFDEFVHLMANPAATERFDHIVFDTAPTGHTLRLLSLPTAWSGYLNTTTTEASCLGPLAGLSEQRSLYESALKRLADASQTTVALVARPERSSMKEAARTQSELAELGIHNLRLIVNAVYAPESTDGDPVARLLYEVVADGFESMPESLRGILVSQVPMLGTNVVGMEALEALLNPTTVESFSQPQTLLTPGGSLEPGAFIDELIESGHGVVMTMGKGGVGKTTIAAQIARAIADRGHEVMLTTTDPAGNVHDLIGELPSNMTVSRIDPETEVLKYREMTLAKAAGALDEGGMALLKEDLRSPCTEEIAVFRAFADAVAQGEDRFVIIDTAPTGHTILLMDATEAYHREVARTQSDAPDAVKRLLPRLRDPKFTRVILVALPEPTPVHEAQRLQGDLARAGIEPFGWVVNRSLSAAGVKEPILAGKASKELDCIKEVLALSRRVVVQPWAVQR